MYILDTNIVTLFARHKNQQPRLVSKILGTAKKLLWITPITVEESLNGATRFRTKDPVRYSQVLASVIPDLALFQILPYTERSLAIYKAMPEKLKQHHRADWIIGSIALAYGYTVVTQNETDFAAIQPAVRVENWCK